MQKRKKVKNDYRQMKKYFENLGVQGKLSLYMSHKYGTISFFQFYIALGTWLCFNTLTWELERERWEWGYLVFWSLGVLGSLFTYRILWHSFSHLKRGLLNFPGIPSFSKFSQSCNFCLYDTFRFLRHLPPKYGWVSINQVKVHFFQRGYIFQGSSTRIIARRRESIVF